jgi:hypothetical protein
MSDICLITDPASLRRDGIGSVSGQIWLVLDGVAFPAEGWDDFILVFLRAWAAALLKLRNGDAARAEIHFMEGPYTIELRNESGGLIELRAGETDHPPTLTGNAPLSTLAGMVMATGTTALSACRQGGLWSDDAEALDKALTGLRSASN